MNCKPGDLAVIVKPATMDRNVGLIGKVVRQGSGGHGWWLLESQGRTFAAISAQGDMIQSKCAQFEDRRLLPIRLGDITNEEVRDLYAPKLPETVS